MSQNNITASCISPRCRHWQGELHGVWVIEATACPYGTHPAGLLVADAAPGQPDDLTFTAANGKRYWDVPEYTCWLEHIG